MCKREKYRGEGCVRERQRTNKEKRQQNKKNRDKIERNLKLSTMNQTPAYQILKWQFISTVPTRCTMGNALYAFSYLH